MSGAAEATEALREQAMAQYAALRDRASEAAKAVIACREERDLVGLLAAVNRMSLAAESLGHAAERLHKAADKALVAAMDASGCTSFAHANMTVSLRHSPATVEIADEHAVPPLYLVQPEPRPDRAKILKRLKEDPAGVNWASLREGTLGLARRTSHG